MAEHRWNPWRALRAREHLTLRWSHLAGTGGVIVVTGGASTIWLDDRLDRPGRNATLAHELIHDERGVIPQAAPVRLRAKEEALVRAETVRRLVPAAELEALVAERGTVELWEIAEHFDVPEPVAEAAVKLVRPDRVRPA